MLLGLTSRANVITTKNVNSIILKSTILKKFRF